MNKEEQVKEIIEQIGYQEFYRYFQEKTILIEQQRKEIERLQNILDELEKSWKKQQEHYRYYKDNRYRTFLSKNLDKLKELKEGR